jgi:ribonuclease III
MAAEEAIRALLRGRGLEPTRFDLYAAALTPRSANAAQNYERLEFLGDSVLGLAVAEYLYARYPDAREGFLATMKTRLVNGAMLARLFCHTGLLEHVQVAASAAVKEDCFEALLGAMYLDIGFEPTRAWLIAFLEEHVDFGDLVAVNNNVRDAFVNAHKKRYGSAPVFSDDEIASGAPPDRRYRAIVRSKEGVLLARGAGPTRKAAHLDAAGRALEHHRAHHRTA